MTKPNISILVTRPKGQADAWHQAFQSQGWRTVSFPTLEIQPLELTPDTKNIVLGLDQYQGVICISSNAAELGLELLSDYWLQWPVQQSWYAVGPATAEAMSSWKIKPRLPSEHNSEGLLGLASLKKVVDERILILKGEGGRETLRDTLIARGAKVDELDLYRRGVPQMSSDVLVDWLNGADKKYIAISSGDGLKNLMTLAHDYIEQLQTLPLVVVSERLATFALSQGFENVVLANGTGAKALVSAIDASS